MRRFVVAVVVCVALAAGMTAYGGGSSARRLPLRSPRAETAHLMAVIEGQGRARLARVDPSTLKIVRASAWSRGASWGWVASQDGRRLAVAECRDKCSSSALRFANAATLRWTPGAAQLDGDFVAGIWPQPGRLYALVGGDTTLVLDTVDTRIQRVVAGRSLDGPLLQLARSADGLVVLAGTYNAIVPARLVAIGPDGSVRTVTLQRILAGTHFDTQSQDPIGTTNLPGLAVDPQRGVAYVVDPSGLVATVDLATLGVTYHQLGAGSLLSRIAGWLTPTAEAKLANGDQLTARWLGNGLIAIAGTQETETAQVDSYRPTGLRIVDARSWSVRTLDPQADTFIVADGLLLATGRRSSYGNVQREHSEGLAAYGPDGSLRWRVRGLGESVYLVQAYRSRALVDGQGRNRLVDLRTGKVMRGTPPPGAGALLLGRGS